jgi:hypothetical protein
MLVSRKNLPLIHVVPGEVTARFDVPEPLHECSHLAPAACLSRKLLQPFAKSRIQRPALAASDKSSLLDKILVGTQGYVFHSGLVYTEIVQTGNQASRAA